jgi:hypothetical protein
MQLRMMNWYSTEPGLMPIYFDENTNCCPLAGISSVENRYREILVAETGLEVVKWFGGAGALETLAGFDSRKTYNV